MHLSLSGEFDFREFTFQLVRHQQAIADKLGINLTDFKCLGLLHRKGAMTPKAIAEAIGMSPGATTTVIDRLEKMGYVERKRNGVDRRSLAVHAAAGTKRRVSELYRSLRVVSEHLLSQYTKEELDLIFSYLSKATDVLRTAADRMSV